MEEQTKTVEIDTKAEKKQLKLEKKQLKEEQKKHNKEVKARAKEISFKEAELLEDSKGNVFVGIFVTLLIVTLLLALLGTLIKLDVGGFGSEVLTPIMKDVPVLQKILPSPPVEIAEGDSNEYFGYDSMKEAVEKIKSLEAELEKIKSETTTANDSVTGLQAEIDRLLIFEQNQTEFQVLKDEFYNEVIYADNGPGAEEYKKYYESIDPTTAENIYKQVVQQLEESNEILDYAKAYSAMKPKDAAAIFEESVNDLNLVARILGVMTPEERGAILGAMDSVIASKVTKVMDPEQ